MIDLEPVQPFVRLRHVRFRDLDALTAAIGADRRRRGSYDGEPVDFLDGTVFTADEAYLTLGSWADEAPYTSDYTGSTIYYRSIQQRAVDYLTVRDYLWRWDTDWFWCSRAFGAQNPRIRRLWPKRWLRSDVYWKLIRLENRFHVAARLDARKGLPPRERVVQDVEIPLDRTARVPALVPARGADRAGLAVPAAAARRRRDRAVLHGRRRDAVAALPACGRTRPTSTSASGRPSRSRAAGPTATSTGRSRRWSPSTAATSPSTPTPTTSADEFWALYGGEDYHAAKKRYDPQSRLLDLYAKAVHTTMSASSSTPVPGPVLAR